MTGKSALGQLLDSILICTFALLVSYTWLLGRLAIQLLAAVLSFTTVGLFVVAYWAYFSMRLDKFIEKTTKRIHNEMLPSFAVA